MLNSWTGIACLVVCMTGCKPAIPKNETGIKTVDQVWLDSIRKSSDTVYTHEYRNSEFETADYYVNRGRNIICQVMRDSARQPRQIVIVKDNIRLFTAAYYANGQLMAGLPLDSNGKYQGYSVSYYPAGQKKSEGKFEKGSFSGEWKYYNELGKLMYTEFYDESGQLVKTVNAN